MIAYAGGLRYSEARMELYFLGALLAVAALSSGCAVLGPRAESYVAPPLGSTWTALERNTGSYGAGEVQVQSKRGERTWQGKQVLVFSSSRGSTLFNPDDFAVLAVLGPNGSTVLSYDPPFVFDFPLYVGKSWMKSVQFTVHATNRTIPYDVRCNVANYEKVAVPAENFNAFKIECSNSIGTEESFWFSPELGFNPKVSFKRSASNPSGAGTRDSELLSQDIRK